MQLVSHPTTPCRAVAGIAGSVEREGPLLRLTYALAGAMGDLLIPAARPSARTDGLWRHTCFEFFLAAGQGYYEFNLSPSSEWAVYRFSGYREGMRAADLPAPALTWTLGAGGATLAATIALPDDATGPLGLSAVIDAADGAKSYWALAHPPGKPDFHDPACFAGQLPPAI